MSIKNKRVAFLSDQPECNLKPGLLEVDLILSKLHVFGRVCVCWWCLSRTEVSCMMCGCSEVAEDLLFLAPVHRGRSLVVPFGLGFLLGLGRGQTQMQTAVPERI